MCGIAGQFGNQVTPAALEAMVSAQVHRGPDGGGVWLSPQRRAGLGHRRLSIIDLSDAGLQPMHSHDGKLTIAFNGEVYNYRELREELGAYPFRSQSDTEVILAAYQKWGADCLDRLWGMFAILIWDESRQELFAARDRFGVKPLYYHQDGNWLSVASELSALSAAGVTLDDDPVTWATYLDRGLYDDGERTFYEGVRSLPAGHRLQWRPDGKLVVEPWYNLADRVGERQDQRSDEEVADEYLALLKESLSLRFRADVPVGINLSGGLDSSLLLGLVQLVQGDCQDVKAFTFITNDERYDELPWVRLMLDHTSHPSIAVPLSAAEVPDLAASVHAHQSEPFGGMPTLAYAKLFERARQEGTIVLLDGQGLDEQWAGYDYYANVGTGEAAEIPVVQGSRQKATRSDCLLPEFRALSLATAPPRLFHDELTNRQYFDATARKIPRALRFNDRVSMRSSTELREPFLDHRLFELALRQPRRRKIRDHTHKYLLRKISQQILPSGLVEAPKRPLQTPQREWLRGELRDWSSAMIRLAVEYAGDRWLEPQRVQHGWNDYCEGKSDNSFYVWQWISIGLHASSQHGARRQPDSSTTTEQAIIANINP